MDEIKLYFCFEATKIKGKCDYMIYSKNLSNILGEASDSTPQFTLEDVIDGVPHMGCGLFGSKLVFTGGHVEEEEKKICNHEFIIYDTISKDKSFQDIPRMRGRKLRPLVFQLYGRLYICDTSPLVRIQAFEIYFPELKVWGQLQSPYRDWSWYSLRFSNKHISGRTPYSWFLFGNCVCICLPEQKPTYLHHARQQAKEFRFEFNVSLPFHGMATTYWVHNFSDVVVISFSKDRVEGRRFNLSPFSFGDPQVIFKTEPYEADGELSCYFADCGEGRFCLTTFDNVKIHVYMFEISRLPDLTDGALNLSLISQTMHKYDLSYLSTGGNKSVGFLGCFVPTPHALKKQIEEAKIYRRHFEYYENGKAGIELPATIETIDGSLQTLYDMDTGEDSDDKLVMLPVWSSNYIYSNDFVYL